MRTPILLTIAALWLSACTTDERRFENEVAEIEAFIASTGLDFTPSGTGLYYHIEDAGNMSRIPDSSNTIMFKHVGYLLDSTVFSDGWADPISVQKQYLVPGFQEGLDVLGEGGKGIVIFPSSLGYGKDGASTVPPYSVLMFKIDFLSYF